MQQHVYWNQRTKNMHTLLLKYLVQLLSMVHSNFGQQLTSKTEKHAQMISENGVPLLTSLLQSSNEHDSSIRAQIARTLANLSLFSECNLLH